MMIYKLLVRFTGVSIIILSIILFMADTEFSYLNYNLATKFNPFEPRYEMHKIMRDKDINKIVAFYEKNIRNPYVVEYILLSSKNTSHNKEYLDMLNLANKYYPNTKKIQELYNDYSDTVSK